MFHAIGASRTRQTAFALTTRRRPLMRLRHAWITPASLLLPSALATATTTAATTTAGARTRISVLLSFDMNSSLELETRGG